jgi:hypothetical protein
MVPARTGRCASVGTFNSEPLSTEAWRLGIVMQTVLAGVVIVAAGVLAWHFKMDATLAGFLGVALGYVLERKTS